MQLRFHLKHLFYPPRSNIFFKPHIIFVLTTTLKVIDKAVLLRIYSTEHRK